MTDLKGRPYYAFPSPEALAGLSDESLKECKLGYRCKYVKAAAIAVSECDIDLMSLVDAGEEDTIKELTRLYGDVWVKRLLEQEYPEGYPFDRYAPYNGVYQQYMFDYYRKKNR